MQEGNWTDSDPLEDLIPKEGWIGDYLHFSANLQACARFRFFTAACALGSVINNKVWLQRGEEGLLPKLFPNPWVMLLGPPGFGNKTQTINMAVNCIVQACPGVKLLSDKLTPESLVKALSEPIEERDIIKIGPRDATGLIKAPELSVIFGKQQYNTGMVSLITDLYDYREEWTSETIMRGKNVLRHICISIIGGSTPDWLQSMLPQDAFTGGFMSRFILVEMPPTYLNLKGWPTKPPESKNWDLLVDGMRKIERFKGEMQWSKEAKEAYITTYESLRPTGDRQKDAYRVREVEQILKVAMVLELSIGSLVLSFRMWQAARTILNGLMEETSKRIGHLTTHPRMSLIQEVQDALLKFGVTEERALLRRFYKQLSHGEPQFHEAISIMLKAGIMERLGSSNNYSYRLKEK
jgi:hypothetical protein